MKKNFLFLAAGMLSIPLMISPALFAQGGSSSPATAPSVGPCTAPSAAAGASASPMPGMATPGASSSPGAMGSQCVTVSIPQGAVGKGPAAFGVNPLMIPENTTVTWINNDSVAHTVTADDGSFDSGTLQPGQSFSYTFNTAGTFPYHCSIHGAASMSGSVQVSSGAGGTASPSPSVSGVPSGTPSGSPSGTPSGTPSGAPGTGASPMPGM